MAFIRMLLEWLHILRPKRLCNFDVKNLPITYASIPKGEFAKTCIVGSAKKGLRQFRDYKKGGRL